MVFVVERYLPGLSRSDLLRGLSRLEQAMEGAETRAVRYLGSTIVLGDEACFCQFDGPSEAAVAEANRKAGLAFDRIVPAVTVAPVERRSPMTVSPSIPHTIEMRRSRLVGGVVAVAAIAATITWALVTYAVDTGGSSAQASAPTTTPTLTELATSYASGLAAIGRMQQVQDELAIGYGSGLAAIGHMQRVQEELPLSYANGLATIGKMHQGFGATAPKGSK